MTHTPGPWAYDGESSIDSPSRNVLTLYGAMGGEDTKADAHLIAAAPELLEALKLLQSVSGTVTLNDGWGQLPDGTEICLNELIAKAEGKGELCGSN